MGSKRKSGPQPHGPWQQFDHKTLPSYTAGKIIQQGKKLWLRLTWPDDPAIPVEWWCETP